MAEVFAVLEPAEERERAFVVVECLVVFSLVVVFVAFFPEFLVGHEARAALQSPHFLVVLAIEEQRVLQVNGVFVENLTNHPRSTSLLQSSEVQLIARQVVLELRHKRLVVALLSQAQRRILLPVRTAHEGTAAAGLFLLLRVRVHLFLLLRLAGDWAFVCAVGVFLLILDEGALAGVALSHFGVLEGNFLVGRRGRVCGGEQIFNFGEHGGGVVII